MDQSRVRTTPSRGFTLIEMLVAVAIIVSITAVILVNQNRFGGTISLSNLAYQIAVSVRQAQTYGFAVLERAPGSQDFGSAYGIHFSIQEPSSYILFADKDGDGSYSGPRESILVFSIKSSGSIYALCATAAQGEGCPAVSVLDLVFRRPEPDARIHTNLGSGPYSSARITLESGTGVKRDVYVSEVGQISVR